MTSTVATITWRAMVGRRRVLLLFALPAVLLVLAVVLRLTGVADAESARGVLGGLALGTLVPVLALIIGTGVIAPEIDDGSIVYLLAKPVSRLAVVVTKLAVAVACMVVFAVLPTLLAALVMTGDTDGLAAGYAAGALAGAITYCAVFLLLGVLTRHAVVVGLLYALLWETLIGGYVPGARTLSIQQWAVSVAGAVADEGVVSTDVGLGAAVTMLVVAGVAATGYAGWRLRSLTLSSED
jgi:ABC-2 type transport system permease protein